MLLRIARIAGIAIVAYVGLGLAFGGMVAWTQPSAGASITLLTFDSDGTAHAQKLSATEEGDVLWIGSGHHFRGWYHRLRANPQVEVIRDGQTRPYTAIPIDDPAEVERQVARGIERVGALSYYATRAMLLFASVKPVRLEPR